MPSSELWDMARDTPKLLGLGVDIVKSVGGHLINEYLNPKKVDRQNLTGMGRIALRSSDRRQAIPLRDLIDDAFGRPALDREHVDAILVASEMVANERGLPVEDVAESLIHSP